MASRPQPQPAPSANGLRRDRPWLLPTNRKLRNLVSISLRNLDLTAQATGRKRGTTIDDDALPQNLVSPAKLVALREQAQRGLEHSRSSSDLRSTTHNIHPISEEDAVVDTPLSPQTNGSHGSLLKEKAGGKSAIRTPQRPTAKLRRRSTLEWANASPARRQERLESVTAERMADVFFSLHLEGLGEPVYVSEVVERTMNPTFRHVDWSACGPGTTRGDSVVVRVWVRMWKAGKGDGKGGEWRQLLDLGLGLRGLQYLGKSLDQFHAPLPRNALIFHLTDGVYTSFASLSDYIPPPSVQNLSTRTTSHRTLPTSSFDALLRLAKLDDSIQDALETRNKIAADLEALLEENSQALTDRDRVPEAEDRLKTIDYAKKTVEKQLAKAWQQTGEKRAALVSRRELMASDLTNRAERREAMQQQSHSEPLTTLHTEHAALTRAIQAQRRRITADLQEVYPLQPVPGKSLAFSLRGIRLPDSEDLDSAPPDHVSAALGYTAHILQMLSFYLARPLPYPVSLHSSTSTILDPLSLLKTGASTTMKYADERQLRTYPLFGKGVPRFRFEYGVFLLNKDIQVLLENTYQARVLDVRQTLPNLKYLFLVATAGEGELPARKAGGVRGLLRGSGAEDGRRGSSESAGSGLSGVLWHGNEGKGKGAVESLKRSAMTGKGKRG